MSKYSALFHRESAASGTAASTTTAAAALPPAGTSSSLPSRTMDTAAATAEQATTNSVDTAASSHSPSSPRTRLVRRRRNGTGGGADVPLTATAPRSDSNTDNTHNGSGEEGKVQEGLSRTSSSAATEVDGTTSETPHLQETGKSHDSASEINSPSGSDSSGTFADAYNEPQRTESVSSFSLSSSMLNISHQLHDGLFTCDACMHYVASSYGDLERHALEVHGDSLADYTRLRTVAEKLVPVWSQVRARKQNVIQQWGEEVFRVAVQRDAGAAKMSEAHRARAQLELVVQRWHPNARVFIFGSSVAFGVWDGMSDIDFAVVDVDELEAGVWPPSEKNAVRTITELLRRAGFSFINLEPISHARVPIIKHHASLPIRLTEEQRRRLHREAREAIAASVAASARDANNNQRVNAASPTGVVSASSSSTVLPTEEKEEEDTQLEAELVIARSVRYTLNLPASPLDSAVLEASIRLAVGNAAVQQVWWNRSREMCCVTFDSTTSAVKAATCPLHFISAGMRARVQPLHEECRPELYSMDFDLSFRAFGIRNSHLLRRYLLSHPCARPGALVLKDWSKSSGVNNSMNGYLTSYAINIMWIYYLVHEGIIPYVSPTKDIPASLRGNVSGDPEYAAMVDPAWTEEQRMSMQAQAGELLLGFFYYYAFDFDWAHHVVSLNRPGVTTKAMLGWDVEDVAMPTDGVVNSGFTSQGQQQPQQPLQNDLSSAGGAAAATRRNRATTRYSFCIEDPYEENLNLGRHMGVTKTLRVQTELYRGLLSLLKDDVRHCCVFTGTSRADEKNDRRGGDGGGTDEALFDQGTTEPTELPLRVLYRLMAIATREVATAKAAHASSTAHTNSFMNNGKGTEFAGLPLTQLTAAFESRAPAEWKVACNAWNLQQLLHRLGLKLHGGTHVLPRREVGVRRLAVQAPPGVVFAMAPEPAVDASTTKNAPALPQTTAQLAEMNSRLLGHTRARHLPIDLTMAVTRGYECLTPAWVAWSKPWAALSAWWADQRQTVSPSNASECGQSNHPNDNNTDSNGGRADHAFPSSASAANGTAATAPHQRVSALPEPAIGVMHQTRKQLCHLSSERACAMVDVSALNSRGNRRGFISGVVQRASACLSVRQVWRARFH